MMNSQTMVLSIVFYIFIFYNKYRLLDNRENQTVFVSVVTPPSIWVIPWVSAPVMVASRTLRILSCLINQRTEWSDTSSRNWLELLYSSHGLLLLSHGRGYEPWKGEQVRARTSCILICITQMWLSLVFMRDVCT